MSNETPKKPIKRAAVPKVSKEIPKEVSVESKSNAGQNSLLLFLFIIVSSLIYIAIFQKEFITKYTSKHSIEVSEIIDSADSLNAETIDSTNSEPENTFLGQDDAPVGKAKIYPAGTKYYLIAGTFVFYPYAEKCKRKMISEGFKADIISTGENRKFHRIYLETSEDVTSLRLKRDELRNSKGMDVWIYAE